MVKCAGSESLGCDLKFDAPSNPPLLPMCCHVVCLVLRGYRCRVSSADFCKKIIYVLSYQCQQPLIRYKYLSIHVDLHYYGFQLYLLLVYGTGEPVVEDATSASTTLDSGYCVSESRLLSSSTRMLIASTSSSSSPSLPMSGAPMLPRNSLLGGRSKQIVGIREGWKLDPGSVTGVYAERRLMINRLTRTGG